MPGKGNNTRRRRRGAATNSPVPALSAGRARLNGNARALQPEGPPRTRIGEAEERLPGTGRHRLGREGRGGFAGGATHGGAARGPGVGERGKGGGGVREARLGPRRAGQVVGAL